MLGKNPIRPPAILNGNAIFVQDIYPTIQTEGFFSGRAAVFLRLGGCNLACKFCDTEFESFKEMTLNEVLRKTAETSKNLNGKIVRNLVVITGGEPFRQNLKPLTDELLKMQYLVQIETNGTIFQALDERIHIACSPKAVNGKYSHIRNNMLGIINSYKFLISSEISGYAEVPDINFAGRDVYIQPIDEFNAYKNHLNLVLASKIAKQNGYKLSRQYHKILGLK